MWGSRIGRDQLITIPDRTNQQCLGAAAAAGGPQPHTSWGLLLEHGDLVRKEGFWRE